MKTNTMTGKARIAFVAAALCIIASQSIATASPQVRTQFFILTAAGSPSNSACFQNAMSFLDKGEVIGYISTDLTNDPAAVNRPHVVRGCQIIAGPPGFDIWDGTNNPLGNFTGQCGSRIGWGVDWSDTNLFLASDIYFHTWSTDPANTLYYAGNLATNAADGTPLVFSSTLRGELWNADGSVTAYYQGETVADHPVNRVIALIRVGYFATNMIQVASDLNYFKDEMAPNSLTNFVSFTKYDGSGNVVAGATNHMSSDEYLDDPVWSLADGTYYVQVEGQRLLGLTYYLLWSPSLSTDPVVWNIISGGPEGFLKAGTNGPTAFFRGYESNGIAAPFSMLAKVPISKPLIQVSNGDE